MTVAFRAGANNKANSTAPSVVVPASCQAGDVIYVHISLNNTNVITATPAGLTTQDTDTTTSTFPNILYTGVVGVGGITAGGTLSWTLSATRQWSVTLYAASGVDNTTPILGTIQKTANATAASSISTPSLTTAASAWILELLSGKSNGTAITSWTAPTGWTVEQSCAAAGTFAGGTSIADRNAGTAAAGTYGGDSYTASSGFAGVVAYTFAANPSGATAKSVSDTASGADSMSATAAVPLVDTASGADALSASVSLSQGDTGTLTDALSVSVPMSLSDTAQATDALTVTITVPLSDTGHGSDALTVSATLSVSDTATGTDGLSVAQGGSNPSLGDTASATDSLTVTVQVSLSDLASGVEGISLNTTTVKYLFTPPQWRNAQGPPVRQLRYGYPVSTVVYRSGGIWHNTLVAGPDDPYSHSDVDPVSGLVLFFTLPTVIPGNLHDEMAAQALTPADPAWTAGTLTLA